MRRIGDWSDMIRQRSGSASPMVLLLLPLVAAILLFVERPPKYPVKQAPNAFQERLYGRLEAAGLSGDELATVGALTLGYKEELDKELKRHFQASGAAHVLAVSGLHTGLIYGLLVWLLTLGGRFRPMHENKVARRAISLTIIGVMWGYAWLTGLTPSVVRAVLIATLVEIGKMIYRKSLTINTIAAAAVLILIVRPTDLWSVSFQLSFAATTAIVLMVNRLPAMLTGRIAAYFLGIIVVSVAAQLGTLPITMFYFKQVSTYFLLANLLVLPIATFLVPSGLATIALGGSTAGVFIGKITWALAWLMNHSVEWIESLPGSTISAHINGWMVGIYYILLCILYMLVTKKA